jgi:UDP-glucuronate 4-epimerase
MNPLVLVTGAAGFIGSHAAARLAAGGWPVVGCDSFDDPALHALQRHRVAELLRPCGVPCLQADLADEAAVSRLFEAHRFTHVLHLAARAGVRQSMLLPASCIRANVVGFGHVVEASRRAGVAHFVYASSSSVYGERSAVPFREDEDTTRPGSVYAATKRSNELMAHTYAAVHGLRCTGLRFFSVYGPRGRPDMAYFSFARKMRAGEPIPVFGGGRLQRDFTYIDDVTQAIQRVLDMAPAPQATSVPHAVCNVGRRDPLSVSDLVAALEQALQLRARVEHLPMQPGDVPVTCADTERLRAWTGFTPCTPLPVGLAHFVDWLRRWEPLPQPADAAERLDTSWA